ncbi:hypothetical protein [Mycobacterium sp. SMC-2]|uniref:hypothetical protein n=1 Tax=Mycobacterium sp. SMC-2 TaxID=2857058 RepID=UPI0037C73E72
MDRPGWDRGVGRITPTVAVAIGMFPMLANPKVLAASAAVGTEIATVRLTTVSAGMAVAYYAVLANSTVAAPILAYLVVGVPSSNGSGAGFRTGTGRSRPQP